MLTIGEKCHLYINKAVMHASLHTERLFALFDETKQNISQERPLIEALFMSGCSKTPLACSNGWVRPVEPLKESVVWLRSMVFRRKHGKSHENHWRKNGKLQHSCGRKGWVNVVHGNFLVRNIVNKYQIVHYYTLDMYVWMDFKMSMYPFSILIQ